MDDRLSLECGSSGELDKVAKDESQQALEEDACGTYHAIWWAVMSFWFASCNGIIVRYRPRSCEDGGAR